MNPVLKAIGAAAVRWLMIFAGAHGVELGSDQAEPIVNGLLLAIPLAWSFYQKWRAHQQIESAKAGF